MGTILPYVGSLADIPDGWHLCDGTNGTPNLKDKFIMGWGSKNVGDFVEAGLPNITGGWSDFVGYQKPTEGPNAFYYSGTSGRGSQDDGYYGYAYMYFDASRSNPIYGNSDTVQPPSSVVYYIMKIK